MAFIRASTKKEARQILREFNKDRLAKSPFKFGKLKKVTGGYTTSIR